MKISLKWLNEFVSLEQYFDRPEELSDLLTAAGLEVEGLENLRKQFEYVVIGQILRKSQHPDADKLSVCEVSTGKGVIHQIVCGAKNHKEEDYVVAALPGAVLPGDFKIKTSKLRGVESQGMLCSFKELGMEGDSDGIIILGSKASSQVGVSAADYFGMDDVLFELKVTPNRADCLSHFGLAREIASLLGKELKKPKVELQLQEPAERHGSFEPQGASKGTGSSQSSGGVGVDVRNSDLCPRYCGRIIRDVQVGESPAWLKSRLESLGMNSINNVVDVTNYVMLELGQPLHAFDVSKITGQKIVVENSRQGEEFQTLDGTTVKLTGEELMIRDTDRAVALAGVVGGLNSGVDEKTKDIFIESAYFLPQAVRKSSRRFGIDTDSAYRFSRGVDPTGTDFARDRACHLIAEVANGKVLGDPVDIYPHPLTQDTIEITSEQVAESLGYSVNPEELVQVLTKLGCKVEQKAGTTLQVLPPPFRVDLEQDMDLVEEFARVKGYDQIPESLPGTHKGPGSHDANFSKQFQLSDDLIGLGFFEARNFAFTSSKDQKELLGAPEDLESVGLGKNLGSAVALRNPLNDELDVMRSAVSPSLFKNVITNLRRGNETGKLFEIAPVFGTDGAQYKEQSRLGLVAWGQQKSLWQNKPAPQVFALKSAIEALLRRLGVSAFKWVQETTESKGRVSWPLFLHPGQAAYLVVEGKPVGFIGSLHPGVKEKEKLRQDIALAELNLDTLLDGRPRPYRVQAISKFPSVERDLALVMPKDLAVGQVIAGINKIGGNLLQSVLVFDIYQGDKLAEGQKSVAFRMRLQSRDSTLSDKELGEWQQQLTDGLVAQFPVTVR